MKKTPIIALSILCVALWSCASTNDTDVATSDPAMISSSSQSATDDEIGTDVVRTEDLTPEVEQHIIGTPGHTAPAGNASAHASHGTGTITKDQFDHENATALHANSSVNSSTNVSMTSSSSLNTDEDDDTDAAENGTRPRLRKD